jgi:hypothetical protein
MNDNPVDNLQPLKFKLIDDDGHAALYQALVDGPGVPGSLVFAINLTIASSVQRSSPKQLQALLSGMKAAFRAVPALLPDNSTPDNSTPGDDELFNISAEVMIELSVAKSGSPGPVNVDVTVETTTGIVPLPSQIVKFFSYTVGPGLADYWVSDSKNAFSATVTSQKGNGTISPPEKSVTEGNHATVTATKVIVEATGGKAMTYLMHTKLKWGGEHTAEAAESL